MHIRMQQKCSRSQDSLRGCDPRCSVSPVEPDMCFYKHEKLVQDHCVIKELQSEGLAQLMFVLSNTFCLY